MSPTLQRSAPAAAGPQARKALVVSEAMKRRQEVLRTREARAAAAQAVAVVVPSVATESTMQPTVLRMERTAETMRLVRVPLVLVERAAARRIRALMDQAAPEAAAEGAILSIRLLAE